MRGALKLNERWASGPPGEDAAQRSGFGSRAALAEKTEAARAKAEKQEVIEEAKIWEAEQQARRAKDAIGTKAEEKARKQEEKAKKKAAEKAKKKAEEKARKAEEKAKKAIEKARKQAKANGSKQDEEPRTAVEAAAEAAAEAAGSLPGFFESSELKVEVSAQPTEGAGAGFNWQQEELFAGKSKSKGKKKKNAANGSGSRPTVKPTEQPTSPSWAEAAAELNRGARPFRPRLGSWGSMSALNGEAQEFKMPVPLPKLSVHAPAFTLPSGAEGDTSMMQLELSKQAHAAGYQVDSEQLKHLAYAMKSVNFDDCSADMQQELMTHATQMSEMNVEATYVAQYREEQRLLTGRRRQQEKKARKGEVWEDWICSECANMIFAPKQECLCGAKKSVAELTKNVTTSAELTEKYLPPMGTMLGEHSSNPTTRDALLRIAKLASARDKQVKAKEEKKGMIAAAINSASLSLDPMQSLQPPLLSPTTSTTPTFATAQVGIPAPLPSVLPPTGVPPLAMQPSSREASFDGAAEDSKQDNWGQLLPVDRTAGPVVTFSPKGRPRRPLGSGQAPAKNPWSSSGAGEAQW
jgi:hypothetical protein